MILRIIKTIFLYLLFLSKTTFSFADDQLIELDTALRDFLFSENLIQDKLDHLIESTKGNESYLISTLEKKKFLIQNDQGLYTTPLEKKSFLKPPSKINQKNLLSLRNKNDVYYLCQKKETLLKPLILLLPSTALPSGNMAFEAFKYFNLGYDVLIIPAKNLGQGWPTKPQENNQAHRNALKWLRHVLLTQHIDPERIYMTGMSRGGHGSWDIGLRNPDRFAAISPQAGTTAHEGNYHLTGGVFLQNAHHLPVLLGFGTLNEDPIIIEGNQYAGKYFKKKNYMIEVHERSDLGHGYIFQPKQIADFFNSKHRKTYPKKISKTLNTPWDQQHYWLEVLERDGEPWSPLTSVALKGKIPKTIAGKRKKVWKHVSDNLCSVKAEIKKNKIKIHSKNIKKFKIFLNPELIDINDQIIITINNLTRFKGKIQLNIETLLKKVFETGDTSRIFWDSVVVDTKS